MSDKPTKHAFWQNHIEQFRAWGLSQQAYSDQNNLKVHQLVYWRRKFLENQPVKSSSGFVAIPLVGHQSEGLYLSLPSGIKVSGFSVSDQQTPSNNRASPSLS